jgi:acetyltransferase-like isoleucine patch superfamily enzyme
VSVLKDLIRRFACGQRAAPGITLEARAELRLRPDERRVPRGKHILGTEYDPVLLRLTGMAPNVDAASNVSGPERCSIAGSFHEGVELRSASQISLGRNAIIKKGTILDGRSSTLRFGIDCGDDFYVKEGAYIDAYGGHICIGRGAAIAQGVAIHGNGGVDVGDYLMMGHGAMILAGNHRHDPSAGIPFIFQGSVARGITIGNNVWIGAGAIILDGVTLGDNVVVGAGTVVSEDIPSGCLATSSRKLKIVALRSDSQAIDSKTR